MRTKLLLLAVLAALAALPVQALAAPAELFPGVTYESRAFTIGGAVVVAHIVTAPKPGGLYDLAPTLPDGRVTGLQTVTEMQRDLSAKATVVGVNGDLFSYEHGTPSGVLMLDGVLLSRPYSGRSSLAIGLDGLLRVARAGFFGNWQIETAKGSIGQLNRPLSDKGVALFTPAYAETTPVLKQAVDVVLSPFPPATTGAPLVGQVSTIAQGGGTPIPPDGAVLQAKGQAASALLAATFPGAPATLRLAIKPWWDDVADAIGGGPALVSEGRVLRTFDEEFSDGQLGQRAPRTAVGQLADGRTLLVAVDGRSSASAGVTSAQLADLMGALGAVTAMGLDSGGSTTLAFDGNLLNVPSGGERRVSDALSVLYYGVYAPPPAEPVVSPNGDGVAESEELAYKVVRPSTVKARLINPGGKVIWRDEGQKEPGTYELVPEAAQLEEGTWRWVIGSVDADGNESKAERSFSVNSSIGNLELSAKAIKVTKKRGGSLGIRVSVARKSRLRITVEDGSGQVVRTLFSRWQGKGDVQLAWDGRTSGGQVVVAGGYAVNVEARNKLGVVELIRSVTVRRGK